MLIYKVHPAIGVARVGDHPSAFFIGPEASGKGGIELGANGAETPVAKHKDQGQIKRQAARFRVFEYDVAPVSGMQTLIREITANDAQISWSVDLVNRKAALDHTPATTIDPLSAGRPRNMHLSGAERNALIIRDLRGVRSVAGREVGATAAVAFDQGTFLGQRVYLGELRTDASGRLLVLGGRGKAASVPPGKSVGRGPGQNRFANNDFWHDDVSDGPVTATVAFPNQAPHPVDAPAWVTVAPPDYVPGIDGIVTLFDVVFQAAIDAGFTKPVAVPSFERQIRPVIERAGRLRFVNDFAAWDGMPRDFTRLSKRDQASAALRQTVFDFVMVPGVQSVINDVVIPAFLARYFEQYVAGNFVDDLGQAPPASTAADDLDRAALEAAVGHSFFPGIEASFNLRDAAIYAEALRIDHAAAGVRPGFLTEIMAVPWQSDFLKCRADPLAWWPSQRPDIVMRNKADIPGSQAQWLRGVNTHEDLIAKFGAQPFVTEATAGGEVVFVEET